MVKSPFLMVKSPFLMVRSPFLMLSPFLFSSTSSSPMLRPLFFSVALSPGEAETFEAQVLAVKALLDEGDFW